MFNIYFKENLYINSKIIIKIKKDNLKIYNIISAIFLELLLI